MGDMGVCSFSLLVRCACLVLDVPFRIMMDYAGPAWLYDLVGPIGQFQMHGHLGSICSSIPSLTEPSSMPEAVSLIVCNSPQQMSWPWSKPQSFLCDSFTGTCHKIHTNFFSTTDASSTIASSGKVTDPSSRAVFNAVWTFCRAFSCYRPHSKLVAFHDTHIWAGTVFLHVGMCWL